ncbi:hypothetical protein EDB84DRAFT_1175338 [Lactarius hengduanensis]|nr:hypothetical protein EDB84DRAFT_1175338 [Lactarius hengduanensis]
MVPLPLDAFPGPAHVSPSRRLVIRTRSRSGIRPLAYLLLAVTDATLVGRRSCRRPTTQSSLLIRVSRWLWPRLDQTHQKIKGGSSLGQCTTPFFLHLFEDLELFSLGSLLSLRCVGGVGSTLSTKPIWMDTQRTNPIHCRDMQLQHDKSSYTRAARIMCHRYWCVIIIERISRRKKWHDPTKGNLQTHPKMKHTTRSQLDPQKRTCATTVIRPRILRLFRAVYFSPIVVLRSGVAIRMRSFSLEGV